MEPNLCEGKNKIEIFYLTSKDGKTIKFECKNICEDTGEKYCFAANGRPCDYYDLEKEKSKSEILIR